MGKHSNILVEQASKEHILKLKKGNKYSKDTKKRSLLTK